MGFSGEWDFAAVVEEGSPLACLASGEAGDCCREGEAFGLDRSSGQTMRAVYVEGLANVLAALPAPARFVHVSSTSVYGQTDGEEVDEQSATEPEEESGKIVLEAERVLRRAAPEAIILRFAGIYGPGRLLRRQAIEAGEPIVGNADKWLNLIQVEDGAEAVLAAVELQHPRVLCEHIGEAQESDRGRERHASFASTSA